MAASGVAGASWQVPARRRAVPMPLILGGVVASTAGLVFTLAFVVSTATDGFKLIHSAEMGDEGDNKLRSSIPISQKQLFIRTGKTLYCIGKS